MAVFDASVLQLVLAAGLLLIHQLALALAAPAPEKLYQQKASTNLAPPVEAPIGLTQSCSSDPSAVKNNGLHQCC